MKKFHQLSLAVLIAIAITGGPTAPPAFAADCEAQLQEDFGSCATNIDEHSQPAEYSNCICASWRYWQACWRDEGQQVEIPVTECREQ